MPRNRRTRTALGVLGALGVVLAIVSVRPGRRTSATTPESVTVADESARPDAPASSARPELPSARIDTVTPQSFGVAGSALLALGLVAGYVLLSLLLAHGLVREWVQLRGLDQPTLLTAGDYWLQVAVSVTPGILAAIWAWIALGRPGGRIRTLVCLTCGLWTVVTSLSFLNSRTHTVTATDVATRYGLSWDTAQFIQAAAYPTAAAILASVIYFYAAALWWGLSQRRAPGLPLSRRSRITVPAVYVVLMLVTITVVGNYEGVEYLV
ncbi:hypothetical protein GCM10022198_10370 [Klugiella xanthotipulae]|uniref:Uncharacterized protein n=1 Tax=Klugiella xanthotipulae TaxID=244735 RepID=A0A543HYV2_9MICO|nr:hypothetical protein [Klugiella xanthotipulae]TQM63435.1 hypothetical protein FB466_1697 [Klugiella xanthotipulae]